MHEADQSARSPDFPIPQMVLWDDLRQKFTMLQDVHFSNLRTSQESYARLQDDLIETLRRSLSHHVPSFSLDSVDQPASPNLQSTPLPEVVGDVTKRSRTEIQYLSQLDVVEVAKEKLTDLYLERGQLRDEQQSREHFGLKLDDDALELLKYFEDHESLLLEELEQAELLLNGLREILQDEEAHQANNKAFEDDDWEIVERESRTDNEDKRASLLLNLQSETLGDLYGTSRDEPADSARFLNAWILDPARNLPSILKDLPGTLERQYQGLQTEDLKSRFLDIWFHDNASTGFDRNRTQADEQSIQADESDSPDPAAENDSSSTTGHDLVANNLRMTPLYGQPEQASPSTSRLLPPDRGSSPKLEPSRLLALGPDIVAEDIIAQAIRTRGVTPPAGPTSEN